MPWDRKVFTADAEVMSPDSSPEALSKALLDVGIDASKTTRNLFEPFDSLADWLGLVEDRAARDWFAEFDPPAELLLSLASSLDLLPQLRRAIEDFRDSVRKMVTFLPELVREASDQEERVWVSQGSIDRFEVIRAETRGRFNRLDSLVEEMPSAGRLTDPDVPSGYWHSDDFRSVRTPDGDYKFTDTQAKIIKCLWSDWADRGLGVSSKKLLSISGSVASEVRLAFRSNSRMHAAWNTFILGEKSTGSRGLYRLALPQLDTI